MTRLETERLILRPYREDDLDGFYACVSDPEVVRYEPYRPMSREEARQTLASRLDNGEFWALERKADGAYIGNLYLGQREFQSLELGYELARQYWGKGYATEAVKTVTGYLLSRFDCCFADCFVENVASARVIEKCGYKYMEDYTMFFEALGEEHTCHSYFHM